MSKHHNPQRNSMMPAPTRAPQLDPNPPPRHDMQNAAPEPMRVAYVVDRDAEGWRLRVCSIPESVVAKGVTEERPTDVFGLTASYLQQHLASRCIGGER